MSYYVYGIFDPRTSRIFYIGQTSAFDLRCRQHLEEGADTLCSLTLREIQAAGHEPVFVRLEDLPTRRRALMAEVFWIDLLSSRGTSLTNAQAFEGYVDRAACKARMNHGQAEESKSLERLANGRPLREGRRWSRKEEGLMRRLQREGKSRHEIADVLDRSVGAIEERLQRRPKRARPV